MENGLIHAYCGDGKGKTTCAAGLAIRCAGSGGTVLWFQFLKKDTSGERTALGQVRGVELLPGYSESKFSFQMTELEKEKARGFYDKKIEEISKIVKEKEYDLLILDETFGAISAGVLSEEKLVDFLKHKPKGLEVVLTGRNPSETILSMADYVSEIKKVKHPFDQGIAARKKIEW